MSIAFSRLAVSIIVLGSLLGCRYDPIVWKHDFRSPDGAWGSLHPEPISGVASVRLGTNDVSIRRVDGTANHGKPFDIFSYPGGGKVPKAYVLSNENSDPDLLVAWISPTHLQITHAPGIDANLEVIRLSNLDINFR